MSGSKASTSRPSPERRRLDDGARSRGLIHEKWNEIDKARTEYNAALAVPTVNRIAQWAQDNARARLKAIADEGK